MLCRAGFPGRMGPGGTLVTPFPTYDPSVRAYLVYAQGQGITLPSTANLDAINTLVLSLKSAGIWDKLDYFNLYAHDSADQNFGLINMVTPTDALSTLVSSPTYTRKSGFQTDGAASNVTTAFVTSSYPKYVQNDASRHMWIYATPTVGTSLCGRTGANAERMTGGSSNVQRINQGNTTNLAAAANITGPGLVAINRTNNTNVEIFCNTTQTSSTATSSGTLGVPIVLGQSNLTYSNAGYSMFSAGSNLVAENTDYYNALNTYMTTVGALP